MALRPELPKLIKEYEKKIDEKLLSIVIDDAEKTFEIVLSSNEILINVQSKLISMYEEAGWRRVIFKADNRTIILNRD